MVLAVSVIMAIMEDIREDTMTMAVNQEAMDLEEEAVVMEEVPAALTAQAEAVTGQAAHRLALSRNHLRLVDTGVSLHQQVTVAHLLADTVAEAHLQFCPKRPLEADTEAQAQADTEIQAQADTEVVGPNQRFFLKLRAAAGTELNQLLAMVAHQQLILNRPRAAMVVQVLAALTQSTNHRRYCPKSLHLKATEHNLSLVTAAHRPPFPNNLPVDTVFPVPVAVTELVKPRLLYHNLLVLDTAALQV